MVNGGTGFMEMQELATHHTSVDDKSADGRLVNTEQMGSAAEIAFNDQEFSAFQALIKSMCGVIIPKERQRMISARLEKRVKALNLNSYQEYFQYISSAVGREQGELNVCLDFLTTHETYFFRELQQLDYFRRSILPTIKDRSSLRIWSAASSSGEEAYTIAMLCADAYSYGVSWKIYGSDVSIKQVELARRAIFPEWRANKVSPDFRDRYLMRGYGGYQEHVCVVPELRNKVEFETFNLVSSNYPHTYYDVVFCRNVLIYFEPEVQRQVIRKIYKSIKPGGYLITGHSEPIRDSALELTMEFPCVYRKQGS